VRLFQDEPQEPARALGSNVCLAIDDVLSTKNRVPRTLANRAPDTIPWFMWKTGTSAGWRDAWAIGHSRRYAAGVWVGRFKGAGDMDFAGEKIAEPLLAALFMLPRLAPPEGLQQKPPAPEPWTVARPLLNIEGSDTGPRISAPASGAVFLAPEGRAVIRTRATAPENASWFLNGKLISREEARRLELPIGSYDLRCVDERGRDSSIRFKVRGGD